MLRQLPEFADRKVLVGSATADDAGVYRIAPDRALVQTVDFFTPIVDDPFLYGQISAANALSDVYAMGGRPMTALNIVAMPLDKVPEAVINRILKGGAAKVKEARCALIGGHSIKNPEPVYGLSVTGIVNPRRMITNARARPGDHLILTKPLGTGIVTTAIKRGIAPPTLARRAIANMCQLNLAGAELAERGLVKAATDITGFGLLGHLLSVCRESGVGAHLRARSVPVLGRGVLPLIESGCVPGGTHQNLAAADSSVRWNGVPDAARLLLADAQTSGGLLLCVAPRHLDVVQSLLRRLRTPCVALIGRITRSTNPMIEVTP